MTTTATHTGTVEHRPGTRYPYVATCTCGEVLGMRLTRDAAQQVIDGHLAEQAQCGEKGALGFLGREVCYLPAKHDEPHDSGNTTWT